MRKRFTTSLFAVLCFALLVPVSAFADVTINEANFPDANFRNWLLEQDYGQDGVITTKEIAEITEIDVSYMEISSLKGIEYFAALTGLDCSNNQLTRLDVTNNTALRWLYCNDNQLTRLDVSKNTALWELWCRDNQLTNLNVSGCTALSWLSCENNQLTRLDVTKNTALNGLDCSNNQLTSLDVSKNTALESLYCGNNQISGENMNKLISSLPNTEGTVVILISNSETEGNVCTTEQVAAIKAKGWIPRYYNGEEYVEYSGE